MKTSGIILAGLLVISTMLSAQTLAKTDSIQQLSDTLNLKSDYKHLKFQNQPEINQPELFPPGNNKKPSNQPFAQGFGRKSKNFNDPNYRMPVIKQHFQSNMPVMKPDSTIHYHLQIKKIDPPHER